MRFAAFNQKFDLISESCQFSYKMLEEILPKMLVHIFMLLVVYRWNSIVVGSIRAFLSTRESMELKHLATIQRHAFEGPKSIEDMHSAASNLDSS